MYGRLGVRASTPDPAVHLSRRSDWLRAEVLGANDGIVSTACLVLGVAASGASGAAIVTAGIAGMAAGRCRWPRASTSRSAHNATPSRLTSGWSNASCSATRGELIELAEIYERRGLARAGERGGGDALAQGRTQAHARDELGLDERRLAVVPGAWTSALSFTAGAALPLVAVAVLHSRCGSAARGGDADRARMARGSRGAAGGRRSVARRSGSSCGAPSPWRSPRASACSLAPSPDARPSHRRGVRCVLASPQPTASECSPGSNPRPAWACRRRHPTGAV